MPSNWIYMEKEIMVRDNQELFEEGQWFLFTTPLHPSPYGNELVHIHATEKGIEGFGILLKRDRYACKHEIPEDIECLVQILRA